MGLPKSSTPRSRRAFWTLLIIAALAMGTLSSALMRNPGPVAGLIVAVSGTALLLALALAARIMIALDHAHRRMILRRLNSSCPAYKDVRLFDGVVNHGQLG